MRKKLYTISVNGCFACYISHNSKRLALRKYCKFNRIQIIGGILKGYSFNKPYYTIATNVGFITII